MNRNYSNVSNVNHVTIVVNRSFLFTVMAAWRFYQAL